MEPYQYVSNNPINLIDPTGMGPELPGFGATIAIIRFNALIYSAFLGSNNTSNKQLYLWANGRSNERNKIKGAVGEGIAATRLVTNSNRIGYTGIHSGITPKFGKKHNGRQVDIQQTMYAGVKRSPIGGRYRVSPTIKSYSFEGAESEKVYNTTGKFTANIEVKILNPDSDISFLYDNLSKGIDQAISNGTGTNTVGILMTDMDAWLKVANDSDYGELLKSDYDRLKSSGNHLRLEKGLNKDTEKAMHALKDKLKDN